MKFVIFISCLFLIACNQNKLPDNIIPPQKMEIVFWDYVQADIFAKDYISLDSSKDAVIENALLQEEVFKKHSVSREEFKDSYKYYATHEKLMTTLLDSISAKQQRSPKSKKVLKNINLDEKAIQ